MKSIELIKSHSGMLGVELTQNISYNEFPIFAEQMLKKVQGSVVSRSALPDAHLWQVVINDVPLELVYEDFPQSVSLEAVSKKGNDLLENLLPTLATLIEGAR